MIAVTRTIPAHEAKPRTAGFTLFLVDVKEALEAGTLSYTPIPKMGSNILFSSQVFFDDVRVPAHRVLGEVDEGFRVLWDVLNPERILAAAGGVGCGRRGPRRGSRLRPRAPGVRAADRRPTSRSRSRSRRSRPRPSWPG